MRKNLWFVSLLGVIIFLLSGQALAEENTKQGEYGFKFTLGIGMEAYYVTMDTPDELRTVQAHPDDSPTGSTTADELKPFASVGFLLNLRLYFPGTEEIQLYSGIDLGARTYYAGSGYREGIFNDKVCDYGGLSLAYVQLQPSFLTVTPVIGLRYIVFIFEVGFPHTSFTLENGHDRWGAWDEVNSYEWEGFGQRYMLGLAIGNFQPGIYYESYNIDFDGHETNFGLIGLRAVYYFL